MKISIITVCLNSEKTIEKTIRSVLEQNYGDVEYIIIDGGSTDSTLSIIDKYKDRISYIISEQDKGIYDAMNKGIALASGEIVGIINSDDWYEQDVFYKIEKCFKETGAELVYSNMNIIREETIERTLIPTDIQKLYFEMMIPHPTVFIKRDIYRKYGGFDEKYIVAADYDFILKLYINNVKFVYLDLVTANFRLGGVSCKKSVSCAKETIEIAQKYFEYVPQNKKELVSQSIKDRCKRNAFLELLEENPNWIVKQINKLCELFALDKVAIFGSGKWGRQMQEILQVNNIIPCFFVDNDTGKWNTKVNGIAVVSPEHLIGFCGLVLVMVSEHSEEIVLQMKDMHCSKLKYISWKDMIEVENL